jgi:hypothetical protein
MTISWLNPLIPDMEDIFLVLYHSIIYNDMNLKTNNFISIHLIDELVFIIWSLQINHLKYKVQVKRYYYKAT